MESENGASGPKNKTFPGLPVTDNSRAFFATDIPAALYMHTTKVSGGSK